MKYPAFQIEAFGHVATTLVVVEVLMDAFAFARKSWTRHAPVHIAAYSSRAGKVWHHTCEDARRKKPSLKTRTLVLASIQTI